MDLTSFLKIFAALKEYGAFELFVVIMLFLGNRTLKIYLRRQRYTELNLSAVNYALEKKLNSDYTKPRDEMLERLLEKEQFIAEKK